MTRGLRGKNHLFFCDDKQKDGIENLHIFSINKWLIRALNLPREKDNRTGDKQYDKFL